MDCNREDNTRNNMEAVSYTHLDVYKRQDVTLKGNAKDTYVKANIDINDITSLIYVVADDDIGLLNTEGIIEFVDPSQLFDSTHLEKSASYYDSLVATLPDFNLTSTIDIHSGAKIKIITNEQSGDYLEASGAAKLDLVYDRTGTLKLSGEYIIDKGLYRVSFYDLVKRNFEPVSYTHLDVYKRQALANHYKSAAYILKSVF